MAEVDDRDDAAPLAATSNVVSAKLQSYLLALEPGAVQRRAVAQEADAELRDAVEVLFAALVVAALLHLVDPSPAVVDGRDAVLDPVANMNDEISARLGLDVCWAKWLPCR